MNIESQDQRVKDARTLFHKISVGMSELEEKYIKELGVVYEANRSNEKDLALSKATVAQLRESNTKLINAFHEAEKRTANAVGITGICIAVIVFLLVKVFVV